MSAAGLWPPRPYKGLAKYSRADAALFVGRGMEVETCAKRLLPSRLSLFILHGLSGSGKSSFLQAGLLPHIYGIPQCRYFRAPASRNREDPTVFQSGRAPLKALADAIWALTGGLEDKELREAARLGKRSLEQFAIHTSANHRRMFRSLERLSAALPDKLFFVIDQAEDVFPSDGCASSDQSEFFNLLALLSNVTLDLKLLLGMRSEYKARFDEELSARDVDLSSVNSYYLNPITEDGIVDAIVRPTMRESVAWYHETLPPPWEHYRFDYQKGLAQVICTDLLRSADPSSWLPVLQVICEIGRASCRERV